MAYAGHDGLPNTKVIISDAPLSGDGTNASHLKVDLTALSNPATRVTAITTTELTTDDMIVCNSAIAITVNLLAATGSNRIIQISNINTGAVTVEGDGVDTVDGELTQIVYQWDTMEIKDYAANKWKIK